jgi:hypothetical protein
MAVFAAGEQAEMINAITTAEATCRILPNHLCPELFIYFLALLWVVC